jgi:hypothetical protein
MKTVLKPKDIKRLNKLLAENEAQLAKIRKAMKKFAVAKKS